MQPDPSKIRALLKKTAHHDKDERFMATSDLATELEKVEGQLDSSLQTPIRDAILKQLDDPSNDVQSIACKCLCSIVQKFVCEQVEEIVDKLGSLLVNGKMELRDIYSIALKNIISSVPEDFGQQISKKLVRRLLQGLKKTKTKRDTDEEQKEEERNHFNRLIACLDIMKDLTARFGFIMQEDHQSILETIQPMLSDVKVEIRKKVAISLGSLVGNINDELFNELMKQVIDVIKNVDFHDVKLFTFIQAVGIFARNAGQRVSVYLKDIVPLLIQICTDQKVTQDNTEAAIDLRENCLQTFDVMIIQCPKQMLEHTEDLMKVGLSLMAYDPNYDYGSTDDGDTDMADAGGDDDGFGDDGDEWADDDGGWDNDEKADGAGDVVLEAVADDDTSWKVRRAAVKMLTSFIQTHKSTVQQYHLKICESLLGRFKEHDTTVRLDIFTAFQELLLASIIAEQGTSSFSTQENNPFDMPPLVRQVSSFQLMSQKLPEMMQQICTQFKSKTADSKVKNGLLGILRDLVLVRQAERSVRCDVLPEDGIKAYFDQLIPEIIVCTQQNTDVQLKSRALYVLYLILQRHRNEDCLTVLPAITPAIIQSVDANYPRVKTRAMLVISRMTEIVRPDYKDYDNASHDKIIKELFDISFKQLSLKDIEGEVKKAALKAATSCLARFGDKLLAAEINKTLNVLNDRLANEITRETSLECFGILAGSPLQTDISPVVNKVVEESASFLRKASSSLRTTAAETLTLIISKSTAVSKINDKLLMSLIEQCQEYIDDSDLHLCSLILTLITEICNQCPVIDKKSVLLKEMTTKTFPKCYKFLQSPLLQGTALDALKRLFSSFYSVTQGKILSFEQFKNELIKSAVPKLSRSSYSAIAQCLSILILSADDKKSIVEIIKLVDAHSSNDAHAQVALLAIGELGKAGQDLSTADGNLENKIFNAFTCESESVKWAASFALGNIAIGNMDKYVPSLIDMINKHADRQYLLLNSLKEIITHYSSTQALAKLLLPFSETITPLLMTNASSNDEGVRAMIAECLGKFAVIDNKIFMEIEKLLSNKDVNTRATMATAIKYSLNKSNKYQLPQNVVAAFLKTLSDGDLLVKRQSFLSINTILRVNSRLIIADLETILPILYQGTVTNQELIREVDLGPFKHRVDDGLPLRKAAFTCLDSLLDSTPHKIDLFEFVKFLRNGLIDESPDIQMLTYQIFYKVGTFHGAAIVGVLDTLPTDLMKGIKTKMNEAKGNKDAERAKDILRAACKALYTLRNVPNVNKARKFVTFYSRVEKTKILIPMLTELKNQAKPGGQ
eukprot:CAMPEP_0197075724 /NCGR_PEP_ID=MMETSP1384-20130603/211754_1 /TAXON_ID=29189 /ORGANISM="Ammonia sp." /LENGTH=1301 /DNA_ID=CAMNT_0042514573 /DNA_START=883 /DNA_END=4788 /DNA_ORIENTATION=-